jgi:hypothetical protein
VSQNIKGNREERLKKDWEAIQDQFQAKTAIFLDRVLKNKEQKERDLIIGYLKEYLLPIKNDNFMIIYNNEDDSYYVTLDFERGEDVYFSLVDPAKPYELGNLLDAIIKELLRLWRLEQKK